MVGLHWNRIKYDNVKALSPQARSKMSKFDQQKLCCAENKP